MNNRNMNDGKKNGKQRRPPTPGSEIWRRVLERSEEGAPEDLDPADGDRDPTRAGDPGAAGPGPKAAKGFVLRLLGGALIEREGEPVRGKVARPYNLALLAYLAASPGRTASRDKIIACFWPTRSTSRARHRLSVALHVLRRELGRDAVIPNGDSLTLGRERIQSDLEAFRRAVHEGRLEEGVALHSGPFLDGFHLSGSRVFEDWVDDERQSTERLYRSALKTLIRECEETENLPAAVGWYEELVRCEPFCARRTMAFMETLARMGHIERAVARARAYAALVEAKLGIPPDPEVMALARDLVKQRDPEPLGPGPEGLEGMA